MSWLGDTRTSYDTVADVGCGPGHVTDHLHALRGGHDDGLDLPAASVAGLLAFWSLIHIPDDTIPVVFQTSGGPCAPAHLC